MRKRVLLIGYNFSPEPTGIGKYSGEMIQWLAEKGYECTVLTTYPYYPHWKVQEPYNKNRFWYKTEKENFPSGGSITVCRCPMYVPSKPTGRRRMVLDISFFISAFLRLGKLVFKSRFDQVITIAPSFHSGLLGLLVAKLHRSKMAYHVQDLQIEAARDLNMINSVFLIKMLFKIEDFIIQHADFVSSISPAMISKMKDKCKKEVYLFANWVNINFFRPLPQKGLVKKSLGYEADDKLVLYSGSVGEKQGLEGILTTAKELEHIKNLHFLICGSGPFVAKLILLKEKMGLKNVVFLPLQPLWKFNEILNAADIHLVIQKSSAADLMLPSKLTTIWAVGGVPLVTACPGSQLYQTIKVYNTGLLIAPDDQQALNEGVKTAISQSWDTISSNSRRYAEKYLSLDSIMNGYESLVLKQEKKPKTVKTYENQKEFVGDYNSVVRD